MTYLDDDHLRALLREQPAATPRPGFAAEILRRAADASPRPRTGRFPVSFPLPLRAAIAAALVATLAVGIAWRGHVAAREHDRIARLRADHARLARDVADVRALAAGEPLLVVEVDGARELVVDAGLLDDRPAAGAAAAGRSAIAPLTF